MQRILLLFILLLPAGIFSLLMPLHVYFKLIIFILLFSVDLFFFRQFQKKEGFQLRTAPGHKLIDEVEILEQDENIATEEGDESSQKKDLQQLSIIKGQINDINSSFHILDTGRHKKELTILIRELFPCIERAERDSTNIMGNVAQIYDISDNLSNSAQQAFDLAANVQNEIKTVNEILNKAICVTDILSKKSIKISQILDLMSNLSSKIHVLSINASIVSARAGVHGQGFEVVAKEIRKLAEETDQSLGDIDEQINDIQNAVEDVVVEIEQANSGINQEAQTLMSVAGALQGVLLSVEIVNTLSITAKENSIRQNSSYESMRSSVDKTMDALDHRFSMYEDDFSTCRNSLDKITVDMKVLIDQFGSFDNLLSNKI